MRLSDFLREAAADLRSAKLRSLLTSLGIIIGVASVVVLLSLGEGVRATVTSAFSDLGSTRITVSPSAPGRGMGGGAFAPISSTLTLDDVDAVRGLPGVAAAEPLVQAVGRVQSGEVTRDMAVTGTGPRYPELAGQELEEGRTFAADAQEAVVSRSAAERFFPNGGALGSQLTVNGTAYAVVGITADLDLGFGGGGGAGSQAEPGGGGSGGGFRVAVYLPAVDVMALAATERVGQILIAAADPAQVDATVEAVDALLLERHGVDDFRVDSLADLLGSFQEIFGVLTGFLAALAGISLLVGGIGIMNIMLVVVAERTREIGIAKAIGATRRDVVLQFLTEAVLISLVGGLVGLLIAWLGVLVIGQALGIEAAVSGWIVGLALAVSVGIGVFFGVAPAWRAARMDPITALRHE
ncbi:MAG TPA: ABC transporter permease [Candidatus Limnocylindria bacterium]|nr:ABC transporter permease [Candidatus Limnocylindria bacterium]